MLNGETLDQSPESYETWMKRRRQAALLNLKELQRLRKEAEEKEDMLRKIIKDTENVSPLFLFIINY